MLKKVKENIISHDLINSGETVLCAVSGGADSVVLLHALFMLSKEMDFHICAAHFNHCIRGAEADADEKFVAKLCKDMNVQLYIKRFDVPKYAKENGYTLEQAGRILRYEFFNTIDANKIAVAHHMDDQAESILMHIIRGSGTQGICGMRFKRDNVIRPLLCVRRSEIEEYAKENGLKFCTDSTNLEQDGTRNKLRLSIIPDISKKINPCFTEALCAMAEIVSRDDDYLSQLANEKLLKCKTGPNEYSRQKLSEIEQPLLNRALRICATTAGAYADIEQKHIQLILSLLNAKTGLVLHLPHIVVRTSYEKICFEKKEEYAKINEPIEFCEKLCENSVYKTDMFTIRTTVVEGNCITNEKNTSYISFDSLPEGCVLRCRKNGDRIHPMGATGEKKLKDFFIDRKIDRQKRNIPLVCFENKVLCIIGMTVAESVKVTQKTQRMLKLTIDYMGE